jgi:diaminopimelate epimerase
MAGPYAERARKPSGTGGPLAQGELAKYHALGNDYLVLDARRFGETLSPARVRALCDRNRGLGSDGILALVPSRRADFGLRIWNPDGSRAEKSGNGLRIFARFLRDHGYTGARAFTIETRGGIARAELLSARGDVRVSMGRVRFGRRDRLRVAGRALPVTVLSVGNPHCVIFVPRLRVEDLRRLGPLVERHTAFPRRTNVQLARVRSRRAIDALVWERGAGETAASGSSACAVAAAARRAGLVGDRVSVRMPGGALDVEIDPDFSLRLTGPVTPVYRARLVRPGRGMLGTPGGSES